MGFAQLYSQVTESVAKAIWDSNRQDCISHSTEGNGGENPCAFKMALIFPKKFLKKLISLCYGY